MIKFILMTGTTECDHCLGVINKEQVAVVVNGNVHICRTCIKKLAVFFQDNSTKVLSL